MSITMTNSISVIPGVIDIEDTAPAKPRTKRTAKGLILRGAKSSRAPQRRNTKNLDWWLRELGKEAAQERKMLTRVGAKSAKDLAIHEQLADLSTDGSGHASVYDIHSRGLGSYTSQSAGYDLPPVLRQSKPVAREVNDLPEFDPETGLPIVYASSSDAWGLRCGR